MATVKRKIREQFVPGEDETQFTYLARYLRCSHATLRRLCAELGIELKLGYRNYRREDGHKRTYRCRRKLRFLTKSETTRLVLRHREKRGQRELKRAAKAAPTQETT